MGERDWTLVVLHDVASGAMAQLSRFLDLAGEAGSEIVQEFPDDCVPIRRGALSAPIDHLMTGESANQP
jgi:hypothetical protein